jgi:hypothetical protein
MSPWGIESSTQTNHSLLLCILLYIYKIPFTHSLFCLFAEREKTLLGGRLSSLSCIQGNAVQVMIQEIEKRKRGKYF